MCDLEKNRQIRELLQPKSSVFSPSERTVADPAAAQVAQRSDFKARSWVSPSHPNWPIVFIRFFGSTLPPLFGALASGRDEAHALPHHVPHPLAHVAWPSAHVAGLEGFLQIGLFSTASSLLVFAYEASSTVGLGTSENKTCKMRMTISDFSLGFCSQSAWTFDSAQRTD